MKVLVFFALFLACILAGRPSASKLGFSPLSRRFAKYDHPTDWNKFLEKLKEHQDIEEVKTFIQAFEQLQEVAQNIDTTKAPPEDAFRTVPEVIEDKGYPAETHLLNTEDGYNIKLFRIPRGSGNSTGGGQPVLLSHGLIDAAGSWVINFPDVSLPYLLADAGYDVWLGNVRGNKHNENHDDYGPRSKEYFAFSFDEQGYFDVPNTLDYIRAATGYNQVALVGHSQGCTQFFSSLHQRPNVADKVNFFAALAPAVYFDFNTNVMIHLGAHLFLAELLEVLGIKEFVYLPDGISDLIPYICNTSPRIVEAILATIMGKNPGEVDYDRYGVMCAQSLGMTSVQNMVHWAQMVRTAEFKMHDYGLFGNRDRYGQDEPPFYDITRIYPKSIPIAVWYGENDALVSPRDTEKFLGNLPVSPVFVKYIEKYAHMDFIHGKNAGRLVYDDLVALFKREIPAKKN